MHPDLDEVGVALQLERLNARALGPGARYGHVALLLAASGMSALLGALLLTEAALPLRTQVALCALLAVGLAWVVYAVWVLRHRRPLYARHRIVAGRMAVGFCAAFFVVAVTVFLVNGAAIARWAAVVGAVMLVAALGALARAHVGTARLRAARDRLERALGEVGAASGPLT